MYKAANTYKDNSVFCVWLKPREGPPGFIFYYQESACFVDGPQSAKKVLGKAKSSESSKALYAWMEEKLNEAKPQPDLDVERVKKEGFGPEAHDDEDDPTADTKMVA
jgi:hypothetical protein